MKRLAIGFAFATFVFAAAASLAAQTEIPKPPPELEKLDYFRGSWTVAGDIKPGPMGPGGKFASTEHNQWMEGNYFLVFHSSFRGSMGSGTALAFMGYLPDEKVYTYDEYTSTGETQHSKGAVAGHTWTWTFDEKVHGQVMKGRFTMKILSARSYSFKYEVSQDGATWTPVMDGKATKAGSAK